MWFIVVFKFDDYYQYAVHDTTRNYYIVRTPVVKIVYPKALGSHHAFSRFPINVRRLDVQCGPRGADATKDELPPPRRLTGFRFYSLIQLRYPNIINRFSEPGVIMQRTRRGYYNTRA